MRKTGKSGWPFEWPWNLKVSPSDKIHTECSVHGGVAQMVERSLSMWEVPGSIPGASIHNFLYSPDAKIYIARSELQIHILTEAGSTGGSIAAYRLYYPVVLSMFKIMIFKKVFLLFAPYCMGKTIICFYPRKMPDQLFRKCSQQKFIFS